MKRRKLLHHLEEHGCKFLRAFVAMRRFIAANEQVFARLDGLKMEENIASSGGSNDSTYAIRCTCP